MNPLYIILGLAAVVYLPTLLSVLKLDMRIKTIVPNIIQADRISFNVGLQMINNSRSQIRLNAINLRVMLNGTFIGTIQQNYNIPILPGRTQVIPTQLEITPQNLGQQLWTDAINQNLQNFVFEMQGTVTANGKTYPFSSTWVMQDFINTIK